MASQHRGRQQDGSVWDASSPPVAWAVSAWQGMSAKLNAASAGPGGKARASTKEIATSAAMRRWTCLGLLERGLAGGAPLELGGADEVQRQVTWNRLSPRGCRFGWAAPHRWAGGPIPTASTIVE
jgi:hypothetical protein